MPVALMDLDNSLVDYHGAVAREMAAMASPGEPSWIGGDGNELPWHKERRYRILRQPGWWRSLKPIPLGMQMASVFEHLGFRRVVLPPHEFLESHRSPGIHSS